MSSVGFTLMGTRLFQKRWPTRRSSSALLICLLLLLVATPARGAVAPARRYLRIGLFRSQLLRDVAVEARGGILSLRVDGRELGTAIRGRFTFRNRQAAFARPGFAMPGRHFEVEPPAGGRIRVQPSGRPPRTYRGRILAIARADHWLLVNEVEIDTYLRGLLPAEMPWNWPMEALKAQAVASRTYVLANLGKHRPEGFDFSDLTEDQLYRGADAEDPRTDRALRMTRNQVLTWRGLPIQALYTSTCGGLRPGNDVIFGGPSLPYLRSQNDRDDHERPYCRESEHFPAWSVSYTLRDLGRVLAGIPATDPGPQLTGLESQRDPVSGYVRVVVLRGRQPKAVPAYQFWSVLGPAFGWGEVKSLSFRIQPEGDRATFIGRGCGHGVGMCQWGARGMARAGCNYRQILQHYYPGTALVQDSLR